MKKILTKLGSFLLTFFVTFASADAVDELCGGQNECVGSCTATYCTMCNIASGVCITYPRKKRK